MDSEEFEQIPWSGLVAQAQPAVDPKWYVAGGVVGAVVVVLLVLRMFTQSSPPPIAPIVAVDTLPVQTAPTMAEDPASTVTGSAITEADLRAIDMPVVSQGDIGIVQLVAEWFVTDYFTRDGSSETISSLEARLDDGHDLADLPHHGADEVDTFVEWARAFAFDYPDEGLVDVSVAFRTVHRGEEGFIRDPVRAVLVAIRDWDTTPTVVSAPLTVDLP
jgi:hypothetical protein